MINIFKSKKSIRVKDYQYLNDEDKDFVDYTIANSLRANPVLRIKRKRKNAKENDFWKLSWSDIILVRHYLEQKNMQAVLELIYNIDVKDFLNLNLFNCSACYKWVAEQIKNINDIERQELSYEPDEEESNAGVERLKEFDYSVALDQLAGGNPLNYDAILELPYSKIFKKMCLDKVKGEIQKKYLENARRKNKRTR